MSAEHNPGMDKIRRFLVKPFDLTGRTCLNYTNKVSLFFFTPRLCWFTQAVHPSSLDPARCQVLESNAAGEANVFHPWSHVADAQNAVVES